MQDMSKPYILSSGFDIPFTFNLRNNFLDRKYKWMKSRPERFYERYILCAWHCLMETPANHNSTLLNIRNIAFIFLKTVMKTQLVASLEQGGGKTEPVLVSCSVAARWLEGGQAVLGGTRVGGEIIRDMFGGAGWTVPTSYTKQAALALSAASHITRHSPTFRRSQYALSSAAQLLWHTVAVSTVCAPARYAPGSHCGSSPCGILFSSVQCFLWQWTQSDNQCDCQASDDSSQLVKQWKRTTEGWFYNFLSGHHFFLSCCPLAPLI